MDQKDKTRKSTSVFPPESPKGWGARHTLAVLGFSGFAISYAIRFNLSLAITAMVKRSARPVAVQSVSDLNNDNKTSMRISPFLDACPHLNRLDFNLSTPQVSTGEFEWTEAEQGLVLGSFFAGYVLTQLPGGIVSTKLGGKYPFGIGLLLAAIFTLLTPIAARTHMYLLMLVRFIQGLSEGLTTPSMHSVLANWIPPQERSKFAGIIFAGAQFGTAFTMVVTGYLIQLSGWPAVFYVTGVVSCLWFVLWLFLMFDEPRRHPRISPEELNYIESSIGITKKGEHSTDPEVKPPIPWRSIFTSPPFWALAVADVCQAWGRLTLLTELPTYLDNVLHFNINQNSWLSAFPYILMWLVSVLSTQLADFLIGRKILKTVTTRKIWHGISQVGPAIALVAASFTGCDRVTTVTLVTIGVGINGFVFGGYVMNFADIARNYAGILVALTNTMANLGGMGSPYVAGLITNRHSTLDRWQIVFAIVAAIYTFNAIFYTLFASCTEQPWNRVQKSSHFSDEQDKEKPQINPKLTDMVMRKET